MTRGSIGWWWWAALVFELVACDASKDSAPTPASTPAPATVYEPKLSAERVPPVLQGQVPGLATQAEVIAKFPAGPIDADSTLGGTAKVRFDDTPAVRVALAAQGDVISGEAWFVPDASGTARLRRIEVVSKVADTCTWIRTHLGELPGITDRPGSNRRFHADEGGLEWTAGSPDGTQPVDLECHATTRDGVAATTLLVSIVSPSGTSMVVQPAGG